MSSGGASGTRAEKRALRKQMLARRRELGVDRRAEASRACFERLVREPRMSVARCVCAYAPLPYELDISAVYPHLWALGKSLALPRIAESTGELHLHRHCEGDELVFSQDFRVREPRPDAPLVSDDEVDVILVPGVAFDIQGYRLGYGKGYYDRLLPRLGAALRIGVGFELQLVASVPHDPWDVPLQRFVSEDRELELDGAAPLLP